MLLLMTVVLHSRYTASSNSAIIGYSRSLKTLHCLLMLKRQCVRQLRFFFHYCSHCLRQQKCNPNHLDSDATRFYQGRPTSCLDAMFLLVLLVPKPFWRAPTLLVDSCTFRMPLQWHNQFWQFGRCWKVILAYNAFHVWGNKRCGQPEVHVEMTVWRETVQQHQSGVQCTQMPLVASNYCDGLYSLSQLCSAVSYWFSHQGSLSIVNTRFITLCHKIPSPC